jgi:RNA polymerase sigma-70 factor, ECF subfamily
MRDTGGTSKPDRTERTEEFASLLGRYARQIYSYILTLTPQWADAEDVFQETSTIIWQKFDEFTPGTNFLAWACQIAYYRAIWFQQRQKKTATPFGKQFLELVAAETASQREALEARHAALAECIKRLVERDRELVKRAYAEGTTIKDAAMELGRSPDAAYKALKRIHRELFECIEATTRNER